MKKTFVQSLFDFSFDSLITPKIISVIYGIAMFFIGLTTLGFIVGGFSEDWGFVALVLSPVVFGVMLIMARVYCELVIALFKVAENTSNLKEDTSST